MRYAFALFSSFVALAAVSSISISADQARTPELKSLIAEAEKLDGYESGYGSNSKDSKGRTIIAFQFRGSGLKDADLAHLRPFLEKSPVQVFLGLHDSVALSDAGIAHLKDLAVLQAVSLGKSKITDAGLKALSDLKNLEELYLDIEELSDAGLAHLANLTELRKLRITSNKVTDGGLAHLAKMTKLKELSVTSGKVTDAGYVHVAGMTQLESLDVGDNNHRLGDECLAHMKGMTKLTRLVVGGPKLTDAGLVHLKSFTWIRELELDANIDGYKQAPVTKQGLANLSALKNLEKLYVRFCREINGEGMSGLKGMNELKDLTIVSCGSLDAVATANLAGLTKLKSIHFDAVEDDALKGIGGLKNLESLSMYYTAVGDSGMAHLSGLTGLKSLSLSHTRITDSGLKHLSGLINLDYLGLSENKLTDQGLPHLEKLVKLKSLFLSECKGITGDGLKYLVGMKNLELLQLQATSVGDNGLPHLKGLVKLKTLNLTKTQFSDQAAFELKKALPKADIRDAFGDDVSLEKRLQPKIVIEDLSKTPVDFSLKAEEFYAECKTDSRTAEKKYIGKVVELSGIVERVLPGEPGQGRVWLKDGDKSWGVECSTADPQPWTKVLPGQSIKIKGRMVGTHNVLTMLRDCVFVDLGKYAGIVISAEDLAKEHLTNREAAIKKYTDKYVVVTGEIDQIEVNSAGAATVYLKGSGKTRIGCHATAFDKGIARGLKAGQQYTTVGHYIFGRDEGDVSLNFCLPIVKK